MLDYFLKRQGFWGGEFLSHAPFFDYFLKPLVWLDVRFLEKSQYWPEDKIKTIQLERIKKITEAAGFVPFWKECFHRAGVIPDNVKNLSDFVKIPIVRKEDLRGKPLNFIMNPAVPKKWLCGDSTSGSTGVPLKFFVDRSFVLRGLAFCQRMFRALGQKSGDTFVRFSLTDRPGCNFGNYFFKVAGHDGFAKQIDDFVKIYDGKTLVIAGVPFYLLELTKSLSQRNHQISFRAVIVAGEILSEAQKRFMENRLCCPVSRCYSTRELGWIAHECLEGGLHVNSEWCYLEIVDEAGRVLPPGKEGRIIVTTFDNFCMPFIRYDTGDIGEILTKSCSCGRTLPLIKFYGRGNGLIYLPDGRKMHHFSMLLPLYPLTERIKRFQIIQEAVDRILLKIVPEGKFTDIDVTILKEILQSIVGQGVNLVVEFTDFIPSGPRGKTSAFISKLKPLAE